MDELLDGISYEELTAWAALYQADPWGERRADLRAGIGHALFANANRDTKQRPEPFSPLDFMPYESMQPKAEQQTEDEGAVISPETLTYFFAKAKRG